MSGAPPERIGPYTILGELGRGGMGAVYRAHRPDLKRDYALKVILPGQDASVTAVARFRREAQATAQLARHPGIVGCHDVGEADGKVYFAMDLVEGPGLDRLIDGGELDPARVATIIEGAARALHFAHASGLLHRDIKPANILVEAGDVARVADFGLAKTQEADDGHKLTQSGTVLGTPAYMGPEQASGETLDARADVYALGATLYECLVGTPPFAGETIYNLIAQIMTQEPVPLRRRQPQIPRDLETITLKCLQKDPEQRYATAEALAADLARWRAGEPITARPVGRLERLAKHIRRNRVPWAVGAVAAVVLLGVLAVVGLNAARAGARREAEAAAALRSEFDLAAAVTAADPAMALAALDRLERAAPDYPGLAAARARATARRAARARERAIELIQRSLTDGEQHAQAHREALQALTALEAADLARRLHGEPDLDPAPVRAARRAVESEYVVAQALYGSVRAGLQDYPDAAAYRQATAALAELAWTRLAHAEASGLGAEVPRFRDELERLDAELAADGASPYGARLRGDGTLTLDTIPSGASVECRRFRPAADGRWEAVPYDPAARAYVPGTVTLGSTPLSGVTLPMGSYLLILRSPGKRDTRYPVLIERNESDVVAEAVPLYTDAEIGPDFIYIPPGATWIGGDPDADLAEPRRQEWVAGTVLCRHEVTAEEYARFVQGLLAEGVPEAEVQKRLPRQSAMGDYFWFIRNHAIQAAALTDMQLPVFGVSWYDATAYCEWRSRHGARPVQLPSQAEWVRAAGGADGRPYVWGDAFDWAWCSGGRSPIHGAEDPQPTRILAVPADESLFGVRDLTGGVREWCRDQPPAFRGLGVLRGGAWGALTPSFFRVGSRSMNARSHVLTYDGFRVCAALPR